MPWTKQQQKSLIKEMRHLSICCGRFWKDGGTGRTYYTKDHGRKTSDRCGSSACRDIYESSSRGDERKDYGGT